MCFVLLRLSGGIASAISFNFSVAVWVGYIALYGVAVQTGVIMVVYLHEALDKRLHRDGEITERDVLEATIGGSVLRLRPKLMTVSVVMASLVPIMWSSGVGSDVMQPIAAPIIGGMITSTVIGGGYIRGQTIHYTRVPKRDARAVRSDPQPRAPRRRGK